jgi:hypothetical protein
VPTITTGVRSVSFLGKSGVGRNEDVTSPELIDSATSGRVPGNTARSKVAIQW